MIEKRIKAKKKITKKARGSVIYITHVYTHTHMHRCKDMIKESSACGGKEA